MSTIALTGGKSVGVADSVGHFQPEIQGLRAVAVLTVIWAHAGLPGLPGGFTGVDIFFVISGFLITRLLLAEIERTGRVDLIAFWARRARRLLPNAYATLLGTLLLALFFFPAYDPDLLLEEITHAALQVVNFLFIDRAVDYFQTETPPSPVLHFWSLSVEEQFYIIWPLLLAGICIVGRGRVLRRVLMGLGLIWFASFAASLAYSYTEQPVGYFNTGTRCWQLATGALLAAGWRSVDSLAQSWRVGLAWLGAAAILVGLLAIDEARLYPGFWALLPTLGGAALLAGFPAASPSNLLRRGLSLPAMQWVGERSYSWYLWHWPLLALPRATYPDTSYLPLAVPASLLVACAAHAWIEKPLRHSTAATRAPRASLIGAAAGLALVLAVGHAYLPALFLVNEPVAARAMQINAAVANNALPKITRGCSLSIQRVDQPECLFGDVTSSHSVVLAGDSHAAQWAEAMQIAASQEGWRINTWTKAGCPLADVSIYRKNSPYLACTQWRNIVMDRLTGADTPDLVILSNALAYGDQIYDAQSGELIGDHAEAEAAWREGLRRTLRRLLAAGTAVAVLRSTPYIDKDYQGCLMRGGDCARPRDAAVPAPPLDADLMREFGDKLRIIDFSDEICTGQVCPPIRNGLVAYRDSTHISYIYARTFAPKIAALLRSYKGGDGSAAGPSMAGTTRERPQTQQ
jgi:peptidoglycan/LPS O-acetylase OafA/YrhL